MLALECLIFLLAHYAQHYVSTICKIVFKHFIMLLHSYEHKYKEKFVILQPIAIIKIKSKETNVVAGTCRYSSGPLIFNSTTAIQSEIYGLTAY